MNSSGKIKVVTLEGVLCGAASFNTRDNVEALSFGEMFATS